MPTCKLVDSEDFFCVLQEAAIKHSEEVRRKRNRPAWVTDAWLACPYQSVLVRLPEGSSFFLPAEALAYWGAMRVQLKGISLEAHLDAQIVPAIMENQAVLLDIARSLPWDTAYSFAKLPCWESAIGLFGDDLWRNAKLSLSTQSFL